jgi:hypothetical protein
MNANLKITLADLTAQATAADSPAMVAGFSLLNGGVDPLGLRQVNFDLMDQALPGINNAATRLRPYVTVSWAWWMAVKLGRERGVRLEYDVLKDFVDRIEVLFVASHIQAGEMSGLLGAQVLNRYRAGADRYVCTGKPWQAFRKRRNNTSLMAPVAYGPSIKVGTGLGFLRSDEEGLMIPMAEVMPAVKAFDQAIRKVADHRALSTLEGADVSLAELTTFHRRWRTSNPTGAETAVGWRRLYSDGIADRRRPTLDLILSHLQGRKRGLDVDTLRAALARRTSGKRPALEAGDARSVWRALQTQQLYRYALEALLCWVLWTIRSKPAGLVEISAELLEHVRGDLDQSFASWLWDSPFDSLDFDPTLDPVALIDQIADNERDGPWVSDALDGIRAALRIAQAEGRRSPLFAGQLDRLPLARALERAEKLEDLPLSEAIEILLSDWLIGQHVYWAVGRSGDDTQRLRLCLEEGGWTALMTPSFPNPTADRLATALSLMTDMGQLECTEDGLYRRLG